MPTLFLEHEAQNPKMMLWALICPEPSPCIHSTPVLCSPSKVSWLLNQIFSYELFFFNFQTWRKVAIVLWTLALETISLARTTAETIALRGHKLLGAASPNILPHGRGSACEDSFSRGHCLQRPWNPHTTSRTGQGLHWRSCLSLSANWQQKEQ